MQSEDMAQAPAHLNEKRKERRVLHSHTIAHNCTHTHETGTSLSSSNGRGVNNLWNFSLGSWPLFFVLFFRFGCPLWSRRMLEENHLPFPSCAALWFDLKFQFGVDLWGTQCYEPLERFTSFFLRLSNGFSWRPFQFAICVFYYWIFLKPILGLSLRDMVLTG